MYTCAGIRLLVALCHASCCRHPAADVRLNYVIDVAAASTDPRAKKRENVSFRIRQRERGNVIKKLDLAERQMQIAIAIISFNEVFGNGGHEGIVYAGV